VLSVLLDTKRALSHLEVQDALPEMDRVTLYRALDCLTEAGLTHKIPGDDGFSATAPAVNSQAIRKAA
jgi:Fur family ferric uptake transcriptional regulator